MLWRRYDVMFWALSHLALVTLTCRLNNRTGWLILSNHAYPSAHLCSNQSKRCHVTVSTYSTNVPWSRDESRLSIHIMWSIPQSRDVQRRKLKAIKYSVCDSIVSSLCLLSLCLTFIFSCYLSLSLLIFMLPPHCSRLEQVFFFGSLLTPPSFSPSHVCSFLLIVSIVTDLCIVTLTSLDWWTVCTHIRGGHRVELTGWVKSAVDGMHRS